jgi:outer membrane murein-binding lipoprotein Lpp
LTARVQTLESEVDRLRQAVRSLAAKLGEADPLA